MHGRAKGYIGEQLAAEYLEAKGLRIIARNKKFAGVEVDILARDGNTLVLCEVKTAEQANAHPSMWVSREQQRRYAAAALCQSGDFAAHAAGVLGVQCPLRCHRGVRGQRPRHRGRFRGVRREKPRRPRF